MSFYNGGGALWAREDGNVTGQIGPRGSKKSNNLKAARPEKAVDRGPDVILTVEVALWKNEKGNYTGQLYLGDAKALVVMQRNDKKGNQKAPDFRVSVAEVEVIEDAGGEAPSDSADPGAPPF